MKLATSLFIIVLIVIGALSFVGGPPIDRRANAELCDAAYALVKRQVPNDTVRRAGQRLVAGSDALHTLGLQHVDFAGKGDAVVRLRSKGGL